MWWSNIDNGLAIIRLTLCGQSRAVHILFTMTAMTKHTHFFSLSLQTSLSCFFFFITGIVLSGFLAIKGQRICVLLFCLCNLFPIRIQDIWILPSELGETFESLNTSPVNINEMPLQEYTVTGHCTVLHIILRSTYFHSAYFNWQCINWARSITYLFIYFF